MVPDLSSAQSPAVSVIVVTWNSQPDLAACLDALAEEARDLPLQLICVDNASEDSSIEVARGRGAHVVALDANVGFPAAVNRGLEDVQAPYVLMLNPDVTLDAGALRRCLAVIDADPTIGLVGCNLRRADGTPDRAAARRPRGLSTIAVEAFGLTRLSPRFDFQYFPAWDRGDSRDVPCIHGAFMLMRTRVLRDLGGLDDSVFMYLEDSELCRRLGAVGLRVHFVANVGGVHSLSASTRRASPERRAIAYLHRLDADLEFLRRTRGEAGRVVGLGLLTVRAVAGLAVATARGRRDEMSRYRRALRWLGRQRRHRSPPPPVP